MSHNIEIARKMGRNFARRNYPMGYVLDYCKTTGLGSQSKEAMVSEYILEITRKI